MLRNFYFLCRAFHLHQLLINQHVCNNSSAILIDNILTNKVVSDISDHLSQFWVSHTFFKKLKSKKQKRRDFSGFSVNSFNYELSEALLNQNNFDDHFEVDIAFCNFYNTLSGLVEKHAPLKTPSKRNLKQFSKPWITIGLKKIYQSEKFSFSIREFRTI